MYRYDAIINSGVQVVNFFYEGAEETPLRPDETENGPKAHFRRGTNAHSRKENSSILRYNFNHKKTTNYNFASFQSSFLWTFKGD